MTETWRPGGGPPVPITSLSTEHLQNIVDSINRNLKAGRYHAHAAGPEDPSELHTAAFDEDTGFDFGFAGYDHRPAIRRKLKAIEDEIAQREHNDD